MSYDAHKAVEALDAMTAALGKVPDNKERLAALGTVALVLLRAVPRQEALDWLHTLFLSLEQP